MVCFAGLLQKGFDLHLSFSAIFVYQLTEKTARQKGSRFTVPDYFGKPGEGIVKGCNSAP